MIDQGPSLILNLYLDSTLRWVGGDVERLDSIGQRESVSDERLEVDQTTGDQSDGFGVLVAVSVLELEVNFIGRAVSEGVLWVRIAVGRHWSYRNNRKPRVACTYRLFGWSDTDDENFTAKAERLSLDCSSCSTAVHSRKWQLG